MTESLQTGLLLLAVGMLTVFVVLAIVVLTGKALIVAVNRITLRSTQTISPVPRVTHQAGISKQKIAAITTTLALLVGDDARIERIERIES